MNGWYRVTEKGEIELKNIFIKHLFKLKSFAASFASNKFANNAKNAVIFWNAVYGIDCNGIDSMA